MGRSAKGRGFLSRLSPALRDDLAAAANRVQYRDKQQVQSRGDPASDFSIIQSGSVRFGTTGRNGAFILISQLRVGDVFGEIAIFGPGARVHDAFAVGRTAIDRVPKDKMIGLIRNNPDLALSMLAIMGRRLALALDQLDEVLRQPLLIRLARFLLRQAEADGTEGRVNIGQSTLAEAMASSRVSVSKSLRELSEYGFVRTGYGHVALLNPGGMRDWISHEEEVEPFRR